MASDVVQQIRKVTRRKYTAEQKIKVAAGAESDVHEVQSEVEVVSVKKTRRGRAATTAQVVGATSTSGKAISGIRTQDLRFTKTPPQSSNQQPQQPLSFSDRTDLGSSLGCTTVQNSCSAPQGREVYRIEADGLRQISGPTAATLTEEEVRRQHAFWARLLLKKALPQQVNDSESHAPGGA
jgi:hypothetical protein